MNRHFAALTVLALLVTACKDAATGPFQAAPQPGLGPVVQGPINMKPAVVAPLEDAVFSNTGCFDDNSYNRHWEFSDGTAADGETVSHRFGDVGTYGVTLVASDGTTSHTHYATVVVQSVVPSDSLQPQIRR